MKPTWEREGIRMASIYALVDPRHGDVRYVGATATPVSRRLTVHVHCSKTQRKHLPVAAWIRELVSEGLRPEVKVLEVAEFGKPSEAAEVKWIAEMRNSGADLLNQTNGGRGLKGHKFPQSHRDKIAAALTKSLAVICRKCDKPFKAKQSDVAGGHGKFCSKACYFAWQRGKTKVVRNPRVGYIAWNKGIQRTEAERAAISEAKRTVSETQVAEMVSMRAAGFTLAKIAREFGVSRATVRTWIARSGHEA